VGSRARRHPAGILDGQASEAAACPSRDRGPGRRRGHRCGACDLRPLGTGGIVPSPRPRLAPAPGVGQALHADLSALDVRRIGTTLLLVGLVGITLSALYWFASGGRRWHPRTHIDHDPSRPAS
jgi:hypothetical protein